MSKETVWVRRASIWVWIALIVTGLAETGAHGRVYKYKNKEGVWVFTDRAESVPSDVRTDDPADLGLSQSQADLARRLTLRFKPANPIEQAVLATVVIKSAMGSGTGFFISPQGHILTNAHVLRKTHRQESRENAHYDALVARVQQASDHLEEEKRRLASARKQLDHMATMARRGTRAFKDYYHEEEAAYAKWLADHQDRQTELDSARSRLADARRQTQYQASAAALQRQFPVRLADGTELTAQLVDVSDQFDLALLKIDAYTTPVIPIRQQGRLNQSQPLFAVGNPVSLGHSVSAGVFSGYRNGYLQTDAKVYPGNSGGPLVDELGQVVGITTFKQITHKYEGLGFAIPIHAALAAFRVHLPGR